MKLNALLIVVFGLFVVFIDKMNLGGASIPTFFFPESYLKVAPRSLYWDVHVVGMLFVFTTLFFNRGELNRPYRMIDWPARLMDTMHNFFYKVNWILIFIVGIWEAVLAFKNFGREYASDRLYFHSIGVTIEGVGLALNCIILSLHLELARLILRFLYGLSSRRHEQVVARRL